MEYTKTHRVFKLLMLLSGIKKYTLEELQDKMKVSERTLYRDLCTIDESGFLIDRTDGRYRLQNDIPAAKNLQKLLHFSEEEACILYETLAIIEGTSPIKERLVRKLNTFYDLKVLERLKQKDDLQKIKTISTGIRKKQQVLIYDYRSSNSNSIRNRKAEVFDFLPDYSAVWLFEPEDGCCKQFKIARMKQVELLPSRWQWESCHKIPFIDAFRTAAPKPIAKVEMLLNLKAYNLLIEGNPLAAEYITGINGKYHLKIPVATFEGIGRFALGLLEEVEIIGPKNFKTFLTRRAQKFLNNNFA